MSKKNSTIWVDANFKRTLNKVLVDLDPYPTPPGKTIIILQLSTSVVAIGR